MKSNFKSIGECIRLVDERNNGLTVTNLLGLSITKEFIPSVANTIGSDMENYKIIKKNQFACSTMQVRRDKKMPIALLKDFEEAIISAAYPVFEVSDTNLILPEYLMMWFKRQEFDREACFYAIGGVRGSIEWDDFCNMKIPVPTIKKQEEIVKEYHVIRDRIDLNCRFIDILEETMQAIFKQWFIEFEFPDKKSKSYKTFGGEMAFHSGLEKLIPLGWEVSNLSDIAIYLNGLAMQQYPPDGESALPVIKIRELSQDYSDEASDKASDKIPSQYVVDDEIGRASCRETV